MGTQQSKDNIIVSQPVEGTPNKTVTVGLELTEILLLTIVVFVVMVILVKSLRYINNYLMKELERRVAQRAIQTA